MAIAVLPYPSMDFTPLDVLTADELDQLVANINAVNNGTVPTASIADGAITTPKIANKAITEAKIDRTSLVAPIINQISIANATCPASWTDKLSLDVSNIPTGAKFVVLGSIWWRASSASPAIALKAEYDGTGGYVTYSHQAASETLVSSVIFYAFTKASGKNTAHIQWITGTSFTVSDGQISGIVIPC